MSHGRGDTGFACIIGARKGSTRLPGKNKLPLGGRPLYAWAVEAALSSGVFGPVIFTTDDEEIIDGLAPRSDVTIHHRPPDLAGPDVVFWRVVERLLEQYPQVGQARVLTILTPCGPFRTAGHIRQARDLLLAGDHDALVSVTPFPVSPLLAVRVEDGLVQRDWSGPVRGAGLPPSYYLNGLVTMVRTDFFREHGQALGGRTAALPIAWPESLDIDYPEDYELALRLAALPGLLPGGPA